MLILTIYIIGVIVAYGLALGWSESRYSNFEWNRTASRLLCMLSWVAVLTIVLERLSTDSGRLCFQWRRKG